MNFENISDGVIVAALGAVFNAGVIWSTVKFLTWRISKAEATAARAHQRIDDILSLHHMKAK